MSSPETEAKTDDELSSTRMPFSSHLEELRSRLLKSVVITLIGLVLCFVFNQEILAFVVRPYRAAMIGLHQDPTLKTVGVAQGVFVAMKVSFIAGLIITAPFWIWQVWGFIAAGLYSKERKTVYRYAPVCVVLFFTGVGFGYWVLLPLGLGYLITFGDQDLVQPWIGLGDYLSFFATMTILLGLAFQLPVAMMGIARAGVLTIAQFRAKRRWVVLGIFILAAVLTPPDPITQTLLAVPLCLLYELGIVFAWASLGEKRTPVNRVLLKRRAWQGALVLLLLALLWKPIMGMRAKSNAGDALRLDRDGGPKFSLLVAEPEILGEVPQVSFRTFQEPDREYWVLGGVEKVIVAQLRIERTKTQITDRTARHLSVLHTEGGVVSYTFERPEAVPWPMILPGLIAGLEHGSDETVQQVARILPKLTGLPVPPRSEDWLSRLRDFARDHSARDFRQ